MEKQKVYYKVVETTDTDGIYTSYLGSLDTSLQYQLFEKTVPVFGKLFLFSDKEEALKYARKHTYDLSRPIPVLEGIVDGNVYNPEELTFGYICSIGGSSFKLFWELVEQAKTEEQLLELVYGNAGVDISRIVYDNLVFSDDFTPTRVIS